MLTNSSMITNDHNSMKRVSIISFKSSAAMGDNEFWRVNMLVVEPDIQCVALKDLESTVHKPDPNTSHNGPALGPNWCKYHQYDVLQGFNSLTCFHRSVKDPFCPHPNPLTAMTLQKFAHAVLACANICSDPTTRKGITAKSICHQIWITPSIYGRIPWIRHGMLIRSIWWLSTDVCLRQGRNKIIHTHGSILR